jgi:membrane protease subunit HflC
MKISLIAGFVAFLLYQSAFILSQTEQALVLEFGDISRVETTPGLKFKMPFVQNVVRFDKRLLTLDVPAQELNATDTQLNITERLVIDAFVVYRITDPLKFYQAVRSESGLQDQLTSIVQSSLRRVIGSVSLRSLLSSNRAKIMADIRREINENASGKTAAEKKEIAKGGSSVIKGGLGIEVVGVRIKRADLPQEISQSTFERMRSDFEKEAQKFRAEGEERSLQIKSEAERERTELLATAAKKAEILRGEGDGIAAKISADAFGRDPEFYDFYRSMQAYKKSLGNKGDTTAILSPDSKFFKQMD